MPNPDGPENLPWGTLEELLLACAVHRFGTKSWDSVAKEIQKRSSASSFRFITSHNCKHKYYDLKRRFTAASDAALEDDDTVPWLDELRSRRITELKGELQRYDLSIVSLQLKVKRLSEEREQRLMENEKVSSDLQRFEQRQGDDDQEEEERKKTGTPPSPLPDAGDGSPAVVSDRDNHSVNASNSTDPKVEKSGEDAGDKKPAEPIAHLPADPQEDTAKATGEDSYNGSSDTIAAAKVADISQDLVSAKTEPVCGSPELVESMADSKRGEEGRAPEMEASDVQSYASLSEKEGWRKSVNSVEDAENQSAGGKSEPLADLLDVIRRHKFGSVFERRLESQESSKYKKMIREHVDLATIRRRVEEGLYRECESKLYRDLLLLTTNATLYFPNRALEHKAAIELRKLISAKLASKAAAPCPPTTQPKPESETTVSRVESPPILKPKVLSPIIACRKRSSKLLLQPASVKKKIDPSPTGTKIEEKEKSGCELEKTPWLSTVKKKRTRDQRTSSAKMGSNVTSSGGPSSKGSSSSSNAVTGGVGKKKKSAMNFMNRIKTSPTKQTQSLKSDLNVNVKSDSKGEATKNGDCRGGNDKRNCSGNAKVSKEKKKGKGSKMNAGPSPATVKSASAKEKGKKKEGSKGEGSKMKTRAVTLAGKRSGDKVDGAAPKKRSRK